MVLSHAVMPLVEKATASPHQTAISFLPDVSSPAMEISYGDFCKNIAKVVTILRSMEIGEGESVSLLGPSIPQSQYILWGAMVEAVANPINPLLNEDTIASLLKAANSTVLFALGPAPGVDIWDKAKKAAAMAGVKKIITLGPPAEGYLSFEALLECEPADLISSEASRADQVACYFHTGGTTSSPKLASLSHRNLYAAASAAAEIYDVAEGDTMINGMPLFHVAGSILNSLGIFYGSGTVLLPTPAGLRNPDVIKEYWDIVEKFKATHIGGVPTSIAALLQTEATAEQLKGVKGAFSGGAALPATLADAFESKFGIPVRQIYGMTETAGIIAACGMADTPLSGAIGKAVQGISIEIRDVEAENAKLASGQEGAVWVKGAQIFSGYSDHNSSAATVDSWLQTGDLGCLDDAGRLSLTGRIKDTIIRSGHNIDPASIENIVNTHSLVSSCAAVGMPDDYAGEVPVVFVTGEQIDAGALDDIEAYMQANISERPAWPKKIFHIDALPLTAIGKVFRPELRRLATEYRFTKLSDELSADGTFCKLISVSLDRNGKLHVSLMAQGAAASSVKEATRNFAISIDVSTENEPASA